MRAPDYSKADGNDTHLEQVDAIHGMPVRRSGRGNAVPPWNRSGSIRGPGPGNHSGDVGPGPTNTAK